MVEGFEVAEGEGGHLAFGGGEGAVDDLVEIDADVVVYAALEEDGDVG